MKKALALVLCLIMVAAVAVSAIVAFLVVRYFTEHDCCECDCEDDFDYLEDDEIIEEIVEDEVLDAAQEAAEEVAETVEEAIEALCAEYDADREQVEADVLRFVDVLTKNGFCE